MKKANKVNVVKKNIKIVATVAIFLAVALAAFIVCLFTLDLPMSYDYVVSLADGSPGPGGLPGALRVNMTISSPFFRKLDSAFIYLGDKDVNVLGCFDERGRSKETFLADGVIAAPVPRAGKTTIVYDVPVGLPTKHGNRGAISEDYIVFDGDQAFLLPALFYRYDDVGIRRSVASMSFSFDFPYEFTEIIPYDRIDSPGWCDINSLSKDAFVFGRFSNILETEDGLSVYAPTTGSELMETIGFSELFAYYADLFESKPPKYSVVLLPSDDPEGRVIGGAGTAVTAASFDNSLLRDWQLLSHRMFHAFYDTAAPYVNTHIPPNLWFNEGLSTYYENMAVGALPEPLKSRIGVDVDRQFALIFDQYLYMRIKDPSVYTFAAMDEEQIESDALTEFLHYTMAPLIVKLFIDEATALGAPPEALLKFCLADETSHITSLWAAVELLKDKSQYFCEAYMLGTSIPPLWSLKQYQPSSREVLDALNDIEVILESWWKLEDNSYRVHIVSEKQLAEAISDVDENNIIFLPPEMAGLIRDYCPQVYAILHDYYRQAQDKGIEFGDEDMRSKLLT
ncbi:MAG: hypothetical protein FWH57_05085 [Oscillospiraceae bacterium]|nr:hypothetical protein [Oscillospiraceae bacterium]MCL2152319.1 hypothetical protein [Oscillospiraceae bacterium]